MDRQEESKIDVSDLRQYIGDAINGGMKQAKIAREADISSTVLSQWLKDSYRGDNLAVQGKLLSWRNARENRTKAPIIDENEWVATPTSKRIIDLLGYAQTYRDFAMIYGGAGLGKSVAIKRYAEMNVNCWVVTVNPADSTMAAALEAVSQSLNMRDISSRPSVLVREISSRVMHTRGLLVIDEAQHLDVRSLECIRSIHDATGIGMVLVGNELVYSRLSGGSRRANFAQLFSRIGRRLHLVTPTDDDVNFICSGWNLAGEQELMLAREIAAAPGALRGLIKTLRLARLASQNKKNITSEIMLSAWQNVGGAA